MMIYEKFTAVSKIPNRRKAYCWGVKTLPPHTPLKCIRQILDQKIFRRDDPYGSQSSENMLDVVP